MRSDVSDPMSRQPLETTAASAELTAFAAWARSVEQLCDLIDSLRPLASSLGLPDPSDTAWHSQLFGKLRPQAAREPLLVAAVCGGTNTGKSLIANALAGSVISRSIAEAARTRHPVASLPQGLASRVDLADLFPGFTPQPWSSADDAIGSEADGGENVLVWREDTTGKQSDRLVLLDTPDIDGPLRTNWQRAECVRNACDVLVAVLTQQKYNDAAVREFFAAAGAASKTVIVIFNMVEWPQQREKIGGWLATFRAETGVEPVAVYAAPHHSGHAQAGRIDFFAMSECASPEPSHRQAVDHAHRRADGSTDVGASLSDFDFDRIKVRAMKGAFRVVLDSHTGVEAWLDDIQIHARDWQQAQQLLANEATVRLELPTAPSEIVWNEIWQWLEPQRSTLDLTVSACYRFVVSRVLWVARQTGLAKSEAEQREDFSTKELKSLKQALGDFVQRLEDACQHNGRLAEMLRGVLVDPDRTAWYADLERRHNSLPIVSDDYQKFVRGELDRFSRANPDTVKWILAGLNVGAVARPAVTVGLFVAGAAVVPAAAVTASGLSLLMHSVGDIVVGAAAITTGEGALGLTVVGLKPLLETLFANWSAERGRVLAETLQGVVLGGRLEEINRLAAAAARPEVAEARRLLLECRQKFA